mgnify:CR=1 FL=1
MNLKIIQKDLDQIIPELMFEHFGKVLVNVEETSLTKFNTAKINHLNSPNSILCIATQSYFN